MFRKFPQAMKHSLPHFELSDPVACSKRGLEVGGWRLEAGANDVALLLGSSKKLPWLFVVDIPTIAHSLPMEDYPHYVAPLSIVASSMDHRPWDLPYRVVTEIAEYLARCDAGNCAATSWCMAWVFNTSFIREFVSGMIEYYPSVYRRDLDASTETGVAILDDGEVSDAPTVNDYVFSPIRINEDDWETSTTCSGFPGMSSSSEALTDDE